MLESCYSLLGQPAVCDAAARAIDALAGLLVVILIVLLLVVGGAVALLVVAARQMREIDIPEDASFFETLRLVPLTVPLALDVLDLVFDVFAAPIAWFALEAMGLKALRLVTAAEGLIPGTQALPTLTVAWVIARATEPPAPGEAELRLREREQELIAKVRRRRAARRVRRELPGGGDEAEYSEYRD